jgi:hypothetical protein
VALDILSPLSDAATLWLQDRYESDPDRTDSLAWRVPTIELYDDYCYWAKRRGGEPLPMEDIWGIIQILWPWVEIVGAKGSRAFTGMRKT